MQLLDDALTRTVGRLPGWAAFVFAGFVYAGFGLGLPYATSTTAFGHIIWNVFGVAWSCVIILACLFSNQQRLHRRFLLEWSSDLRRLSATEFEWLIRALEVQLLRGARLGPVPIQGVSCGAERAFTDATDGGNFETKGGIYLRDVYRRQAVNALIETIEAGN